MSDLQALGRLWPLLRAHRATFVATVVAGLLGQLSVAAAGVGTAWLVGQAVTGAAPTSTEAGRVVLVAVAAAVVVAAVCTWWEMLLSHDLAYLVLASLRVRLFDRLRRILPGRTPALRSGDLSNVVMADIESLEWIYAHVFAQVFAAAAVLTSGAVVLGLVHPALLAVLLPAAALVVSVPWWLRRTAERQGTELREQSAALSSDVVDLLQGLPELTAAGALGRRRVELARSTDGLTRLGRRIAARVGVETAAGEVFVSAAGVVALLLTATSLSGVPRADLPVVLALTGAVLAPAAAVAGTLKEAGSLRGAANRIFSLMDSPDATPPPRAGAWTPAASDVPVLLLERVRFGYDPQRPVLRAASLEVRRGETVALVGRSGCGKSTTVALAQRFWDPDGGRVLVLGQDLRDLPDDELRRRVAVVGQDVQLFAGTLRENLTMAVPEASDAAVEEVVSTARLDALVQRLPEGLETVLGERGARLSGGERARVAVARALLVRPDLLVLDEAVANLDVATELELHESLDAGSGERGTLVVSHRRSTVLRADRVVVLRDGEVVQEGSAHELLARPGPLVDLLDGAVDDEVRTARS